MYSKAEKERMYVQQLVFFLLSIMLDNVCGLGIGLAELRGERLVRAGWVGRRQIGLLDVGVGD